MPHSADFLYSAAAIRAAERIAIDELQISGRQLMCRAGQAAFIQLQQRWPSARELTVFCGAGNNGGDGYVLARLALLAAYRVTVYSVTEVSGLKNDALTAYQDFLQAGGMIVPCADFSSVSCCGVIVDALLGTGLNRLVAEPYLQTITAINASSCPVLAIDLPSGLHADTGVVLGCAVKAALTVTFIGWKCGLFTADAADYRGEMVLADLNLPADVFTGQHPVARLVAKQPLAQRTRTAHKGKFGHVLLIGGNHGYSGAIRLAAEAALRTGAGLVSVATRASHSELLNIGRPELMCHGVETPSQLQILLDKAGVVVIGPGLGQDEWAQNLFQQMLNCGLPSVIDADALNLLAGMALHKPNWILTPHPGEAARLLSCSTAEIAQDRFAAVQALQNTYGGVCLLKGTGSLIADGHQLGVLTTGNPGMASGGMGDVLAGIIGSLLAQNLSLIEAAEQGGHIHGEAADRVAAKRGERGMLASDLFAELAACVNTVVF